MKLHAASILLLFGTAATVLAQNTPEMREVLSRLERLEKENEALTEELRALRKDLAAAAAATAECRRAAAAEHGCRASRDRG